jgi:hypothetical protein
MRPSAHLVYATSHLSLSHFIHIWYLDWPWSEHLHIIPISRMVDFCERYSPFRVVWPYVRPYILCTQLVICLLSHFIHIWCLGWPWSEHAHTIPISWMVDFCESYCHFHVCLTIRLFPHLVYATSHLSLSHFFHIWYLGWPWSEHTHIILILRMVDFCERYSFFHIVWPYVHPHILCTQLVICLLSHFIHIWYLGWPWSEHTHIILISRMVDFCERYSLFHVVWPYVHPHIMCTQLVICLLSHFIHLWYLGWPWSEHARIIPISRMVDFCEGYTHFQVCLTIRPSAYLVYATSHLSFVGFYSYLVSWLAMIWVCAYYTDFIYG